MVVVQVVVGWCLHNLAIMRIVGCHQGCCILGHSCYDDQLLWSLVVALWWLRVVVQLVVICDCLHKQSISYYEDRCLLSCCFGDRGGDGCVSQENLQKLPLLIFRYLLFAVLVWHLKMVVSPKTIFIDIQISALCRIGLTLHRNRMSRCAASCQGEDCHAEKWESLIVSFTYFMYPLVRKSSYADNLREKVIENLLQNLQSRNQNRHPHAR